MPRYQRGRLRVGATRWTAQQRRTSSTVSNDTESSSPSDSDTSSSHSSCSSQSSRNSSVSAASRNTSDSDHSNHQQNSNNEQARNSANSDNSNDSTNSDIEVNSDAESNATNASSGRSSISLPIFNQRDSDSPDSDRSQRYRISTSTSNSSSDSNNDSSPASPQEASPRGSNNSFLGSFRLANSDDETSFRPLRLELPESPNPSIRSNDSHRSDISQPSPRSHRITSFFFGIPHRLRGRGRSRPSTQNIDLPADSLDEYPHIFRNWDHTPPPWTSTVMTGPTSSAARNGDAEASLFTFECSVCLESLDAPASIELGVSQAEGQATPPANDAMPVPGSSRGSRGNPRGRKAPLLLHTLSLTDVVTTHCGHLYHRVCLEKWFSEQGKRTCPSCRKATPSSKVIRLFPSISADATSQLRRTGNEAGPSAAIPAAPPALNNVPNDSAAAAVVPVSQPTGSASRACDKQQCQDAKVIHNTLINDYNDLQRRFDNLHEDDQIKEAQLRSLEEANVMKTEEVLTLKRELEEIRAERGSVSVGSKRRRH